MAEIVDLDAWHHELEQEAAAAPPEPAAEEPPTPLYERYKAAREAIWQVRQTAMAAHRERWDRQADAIRQWDAGVRAVIRDLPGQERPVERLLQRNRREQAWIDFRAAEQTQRQAIKDRHVLPSWTEWLESEAARGAADARQAIERRECKARDEQKIRLHALDDVELCIATRNDARPDAQSSVISDAHYVRLAGATDARSLRLNARSLRRTRNHPVPAQDP